jgi:hypothetical protein
MREKKEIACFIFNLLARINYISGMCNGWTPYHLHARFKTGNHTEIWIRDFYVERI